MNRSAGWVDVKTAAYEAHALVTIASGAVTNLTLR